jgi:hypothetical protein
MTRLDPKQVVQELARGIPPEYHDILFLAGSLAVAHHFRKSLASFAINTKDADLVVSVSPQEIARCKALTEVLLGKGWTPRTSDSEFRPQLAPEPKANLPAIRLDPPKPLGYFIEFLGLPGSDPVVTKDWAPLHIKAPRANDTGWYGIPIYRFMGIATEGLLSTDTPIRCANPLNVALSLLLPHKEVGEQRMKAKVGFRTILRSAKDLGRAIAIARLAGRENVESWPESWAPVLQRCFPTTYRAIAAETGKGLRALLADPVALEEAYYSATYQGFLVQDAVTLDGFRGDAERLLVDAVEPFEASI